MVKKSPKDNPLLGIWSSHKTSTNLGAGSVNHTAGTGWSTDVASAILVAIPMVMFEKLNAIFIPKKRNDPVMDNIQINLYAV